MYAHIPLLSMCFYRTLTRGDTEKGEKLEYSKLTFNNILMEIQIKAKGKKLILRKIITILY